DTLAMGLGTNKVRIYCSPFSRTIDTAKAVAEVVQLDPSQIKCVEHLRERYFGPALELKSHEHYPEILALDEHNSLVGPIGGESVADVAVLLTREGFTKKTIKRRRASAVILKYKLATTDSEVAFIRGLPEL
ncbi:hypothetical protein GOP47_0007333, partial [Adiantum capillus-veneris]